MIISKSIFNTPKNARQNDVYLREDDSTLNAETNILVLLSSSLLSSSLTSSSLSLQLLCCSFIGQQFSLSSNLRGGGELSGVTIRAKKQNLKSLKAMET